MSQSHSQTILTKENRVNTVVIKGDTLIQFKLSDAKLILTDVLEKQKLDSLVSEYKILDSLKNTRIKTQDSIIGDLESIISNDSTIINNQNLILGNKDKELVILNDIIKQQKKEIRKQKVLKIIGFTAAVVLPITVLILTN
jgi:hypothetical protein